QSRGCVCQFDGAALARGEWLGASWVTLIYVFLLSVLPFHPKDGFGTNPGRRRLKESKVDPMGVLAKVPANSQIGGQHMRRKNVETSDRVCCNTFTILGLSSHGVVSKVVSTLGCGGQKRPASDLLHPVRIPLSRIDCVLSAALWKSFPLLAISR